ncbi:M23 family metallopeptidase [Actinomyces minihominis]|uniref:M23 family metallopeptidase n=1 Tax=Actinomyces minihominis TaxID=2002838 RepID=UPI0013ED5B73|nr:M23 family metallopeptidase [Actinomyces minihominis]
MHAATGSLIPLASLVALSALLLPGVDRLDLEGSASAWSWPTGNAVPVNRAFDPPELPWLRGHRGVDIAAPVGSVVAAPASGTVVHAGLVFDRQSVSILHDDGLRSTYEPVVPLVQTGQSVRRGDPIATVEDGHSPGTLHWGARFGKNEYVDPTRLLFGPSVLKPVD